MATLASLKSKIAKLEAQAEALARKESLSVLARIHKLMDDHGLTLADIGNTKSSVRKSANARYRDSKTGATWTGHGRAPGWIANVKDRSKYLIDGRSKNTVAAKKKTQTARKGNYVRGPQPMKYRDPKTGAEWSGRGRAPTWLANAKDRNKFLIA